MTAKWTADDVRKMLTNPVYAGMGLYPPIVAEDLWLASNVVRIAKEGAEAVVESVLMQFRETFPEVQIPDATPYVQQAQGDPPNALRRLLTDLRNLVAT